MSVYYNEIDPGAAAWLRELMGAGVIPQGHVDERSIEDILPSELAEYSQCHFFAGIGGWSYALRLAGWPDDRPVWTGSCPCQPFSVAGKGAGFADKRHLWPAWFHLISQCRPPVIFGEQVANSDLWFDLVSSDLEAEGYTIGSAVLGAHSVGAPHIRQRRYFVADANNGGQHPLLRPEQNNSVENLRSRASSGLGRPMARGHQSESGELADADGGNTCAEREQRSGQHGLQPKGRAVDKLEHAESLGRVERRPESSRGSALRGCEPSSVEYPGGSRRKRRETPTSGHHDERPSSFGPQSKHGLGVPMPHWGNAEWLPCRDGKARPVEPGAFPLAHGIPGRVGLLRGYGNAIVPQVAAAFIKAYEGG